MSPFGAALSAYQAGRHDASFEIIRDDGFHCPVPAEKFFCPTFSELETVALDGCRGTVLDLGAGAGRHSLELQRRGLEVWSLDILPEACEVMRQRGVPHPVCGDALVWKERTFDTLLMLMNGIGLTGTLERLGHFLGQARDLAAPGGQILCDSLDVLLTQERGHLDYHEGNLARGLPVGQQYFHLEFEGQSGEVFPWLHLEPPALFQRAAEAGWRGEILFQEPGGHYLARLTRS
jgi:SAM-dependent methyltransferase